MQPLHFLGAAAACIGLGLLFSNDFLRRTMPAAPLPPAPPAEGHYVFVIEGDRDQLSITHASQKQDPWAGVPKGLTSEWAMSIRDDGGNELANVPLDFCKFDLRPEAKGKPQRSEGCIVHDSRIAMLANAPHYAAAANYVFLRGKTLVGTVDAATVRQLAGGGR